jgi:glycerol-3-phosphate O-acyltransferase
MVRLPWNRAAGHAGSPGEVIDRIEASSAFREAVAEQAALAGRPSESVRREAHEALREMVAAEDHLATEAWSRMGHWLSRAYEIDTDRSNLEQLRALDRSRTLVFLPNHRSYLDPFVLRSVLESAGFPPNYVLGGSNLSFFPLGPIGQRSGLVFIRRQFKDAPVYKAMLGVYLAHLVEEGANLEWYIEGGRTRTGKLRPPRMGILSYLLDAFDASGVDDLTFVPVSIIYDQQHEVGAIAEEESGGTKKPESVKWAYRYARAQGARRGKVHVRFADPLALRPLLDELGVTGGSGDARAAVPKVAFEVANRINRVTPVTAPAVVTLVLLDDPDRALTEREMRLGALPLAQYMAARDLPIASGLFLDQATVLNERIPSEGKRGLETLVRRGVVTRFDGGLEPVYSIPPDRYLEAAFYRNTLSHFFVTRSIVELALVAAAERGAADLTAAAWEEALALRDLLKYEFFFATKVQFDTEVRAEMELMYPGWESADVSAEQILPLMRTLPFRASPRILSPFLEAYSVLAERLAARTPDEPVDEDALVAECIGIARQRVLQQVLHSPESASKDLFKNALQLARNRGLLDGGAPDVAVRRQAFAEELAQVVRRARELREMARPDPGSPAPAVIDPPGGEAP